MKKQTKKTKQKSSPAGCLFWIAVILLFIIIFFLNHKNIEEVISSTGFFDLIRSDQKEKSLEIERITEKETKTKVPDEINITLKNTVKQDDKTELIPDSDIKTNIPEPEFNFRESRLYFVNVSSEGNINLINLKRKIKYTDSPLTASLTSLLSGLTPSEINSGFISLIPENTKIKSIKIKDGTAFIDFNESFLFNSFGREGYIGQLKQIIYTATEYSTVKRVQILIEGEIKKYLGSEGIFIGQPLTRNSF